MDVKRFRLLGLPAILLAYTFLYIATTKKDNFRCDEKCQKFIGIDTLLRKNRPYILHGQHCNDSTVCVYVKDSVSQNWSQLSDTVCMYMNAVSLFNYRVIISSVITGDTLVNKKCP